MLVFGMFSPFFWGGEGPKRRSPGVAGAKAAVVASGVAVPILVGQKILKCQLERKLGSNY